LLIGRPLQIVIQFADRESVRGERETDLVILGGYVYPRTACLGAVDDPHARRHSRPPETIMSVGGISNMGLFNSNLLLVKPSGQRCDQPTRSWSRGSHEDRQEGADVPVRVDGDRHADRRSRITTDQRGLIAKRK